MVALNRPLGLYLPPPVSSILNDVWEWPGGTDGAKQHRINNIFRVQMIDREIVDLLANTPAVPPRSKLRSRWNTGGEPEEVASFALFPRCMSKSSERLNCGIVGSIVVWKLNCCRYSKLGTCRS